MKTFQATSSELSKDGRAYQALASENAILREAELVAAQRIADLERQLKDTENELCLTRDEYAQLQKQNEDLEKKNEQLLAKNEVLREAAMQDALTGFLTPKGGQIEFAKLVNRICRENRTSATLKEAGQPAQESYLAVLFVDIDNFKRINDTYTHDGGDVALATVSDILAKAARDEDVLIRNGGEELLICARIEAASALEAQRYATEMAERMRQAVQENGYTIGDEKKPVTCSIGVAVTQPAKEMHVPRLSELKSDKDLSYKKDMAVTKSDQMMYLAKNNGRNAVVYMDEGQKRPVIYGREHIELDETPKDDRPKGDGARGGLLRQIGSSLARTFGLRS